MGLTKIVMLCSHQEVDMFCGYIFRCSKRPLRGVSTTGAFPRSSLLTADNAHGL